MESLAENAPKNAPGSYDGIWSGLSTGGGAGNKKDYGVRKNICEELIEISLNRLFYFRLHFYLCISTECLQQQQIIEIDLTFDNYFNFDQMLAMSVVLQFS